MTDQWRVSHMSPFDCGLNPQEQRADTGENGVLHRFLRGVWLLYDPIQFLGAIAESAWLKSLRHLRHGDRIP